MNVILFDFPIEKGIEDGKTPTGSSSGNSFPSTSSSSSKPDYYSPSTKAKRAHLQTAAVGSSTCEMVRLTGRKTQSIKVICLKKKKLVQAIAAICFKRFGYLFRSCQQDGMQLAIRGMRVKQRQLTVSKTFLKLDGVDTSHSICQTLTHTFTPPAAPQAAVN